MYSILQEFVVELKELYKGLINKQEELTEIMWRAQYWYPDSNEIHDLLHHIKNNVVKDLKLKDFNYVNKNEEMQEMIEEIKESAVKMIVEKYENQFGIGRENATNEQDSENTSGKKDIEIDVGNSGCANDNSPGNRGQQEKEEKQFHTPDVKVTGVWGTSPTYTQLFQSSQFLRHVDSIIESRSTKEVDNKEASTKYYEESPGKRRKLRDFPTFSLGLTQTEEHGKEKENIEVAQIAKGVDSVIKSLPFLHVALENATIPLSERLKAATATEDISDILAKLEKYREEAGLISRMGGLGFVDFLPKEKNEDETEKNKVEMKKGKRKIKPAIALQSPYKNREVDISADTSDPEMSLTGWLFSGTGNEQ